MHEASPLSHRATVCSSSCRKAQRLLALAQQTRRGPWQEDAPPHLPAPAPEGTLRLPPTPSPAGQHPLQAAAAAPPPPQACCRTLEPSCAPAAREGPPGPPTGSRSRAVQGALMPQTATPQQPGRAPLVLLHGRHESVSHAGSSRHAAVRKSVLPGQRTAMQGSQMLLSSR